MGKHQDGDPYPAGAGARSIDSTLRRLRSATELRGGDVGVEVTCSDLEETLDFIAFNDRRSKWVERPEAPRYAEPGETTIAPTWQLGDYNEVARIWLAKLPWIRARWLIVGSAIGAVVARMLS